MSAPISNNNREPVKPKSSGCCAALVVPSKWCCWQVKELFVPTESEQPSNCCASFSSRLTLFVIAIIAFIPCGVLALIGLPFSACCKNGSEDPTTKSIEQVRGRMLPKSKARPVPSSGQPSTPSNQNSAQTLSGHPLSADDFKFSSNDEFLDKASIFIMELKSQNKKAPAIDLSNLGPKAEETTIITQLVNEQNGFIIGEAAKDASPKRFLKDNMEYLKACGVKVIFLESVYAKDQPVLDQYFAGQIGSDDTKVLGIMEQISTMAMQNGTDLDYTDWAIIEEAKKHGVKVVGLDFDRHYNQGGARIVKFNYFAAKIMDRELMNYGADDKFCALVTHRHLCVQDNDPYENLGLSEIFECPAITVRDNRDDPTEYAVKYTKLPSDGYKGTVHANIFCAIK